MPIPERVWQCINVDYLGPWPDGSYMFVVMDQRSRLPEVEFVNNTSANTLIPFLERMFSRYGIPETIISYNGPPYMIQNGITHRKITPLWPQANGEAERFMKPLTKISQTAKIEKKTTGKVKSTNFCLPTDQRHIQVPK